MSQETKFARETLSSGATRFGEKTGFVTRMYRTNTPGDGRLHRGNASEPQFMAGFPFFLYFLRILSRTGSAREEGVEEGELDEQRHFNPVFSGHSVNIQEE